MPVFCKVCNAIELHSESRKDYGICGDCVDTLGLAPMPPARRPPLPCMRCNAQRFVRAVPRTHAMHPTITTRGPVPVVAVNKATFPVVLDQHLFGTATTAVMPDATAGMGTLEAYICVKCGYVEWYCWEPEELPIGPEHMTEIIDYSTAAPYR